MTAVVPVHVERLGPNDTERACRTFELLVEVFGEGRAPVTDEYIDGLLALPSFWVFSATVGTEIVGGLTAHTLPMTSSERSEVFLYDIAVHPRFQRRGIGRRLVDALCTETSRAGIDVVFVPADDEDTHALAFYDALGATRSKVMLFEFSR